MLDLKTLVPFGNRNVRTPSRSEARDPFYALRREMDQLFDDFLGAPAAAGRAGAGVGIWPQLDVREDGKEMVITAEVPGVNEDDVEIDVNGDILTIKGEKKSEHEEEEGGRYISERSYGSFSRSLRLPFDIDADKADAAFKDGVLTIRLPKPEDVQKQPHRIEVKKAA